MDTLTVTVGPESRPVHVLFHFLLVDHNSVVHSPLCLLACHLSVVFVFPCLALSQHLKPYLAHALDPSRIMSSAGLYCQNEILLRECINICKVQGEFTVNSLTILELKSIKDCPWMFVYVFNQSVTMTTVLILVAFC